MNTKQVAILLETLNIKQVYILNPILTQRSFSCWIKKHSLAKWEKFEANEEFAKKMINLM